MFINLDSTGGERFEFFTSKINAATGETEYAEPEKDPVSGECAWVTLRNPQPFWEERLKNRKRKVEHVLNPKTRQMERISYYDESSPEENQKDMAAFWEYVIEDFGGFRDAKTKQEIVCTPENKLAMGKLPVFQRFAYRCFERMEESMVAQKKAEEKNLSTGLSKTMKNAHPA